MRVNLVKDFYTKVIALLVEYEEKNKKLILVVSNRL